MLIRKIPGWALPESAATAEQVFNDRRRLIKGMAASSILAAGAPLLGACDSGEAPPRSDASGDADDPLADLFPTLRNHRYQVARDVTPEQLVTTHNNFIEFGSHKRIWKAAQDLSVRPWDVVIDGHVESPMTIAADDLIRKMPLEERLYRHRCVEAWSMIVPWSGFPLRALVDLSRPLQSAKYLTVSGFQMPKVASGQRQTWYPWPYTEGLAIAEAANELAFIVTGAYGKPLLKQNGAPLRLAVPWKYGFKSIKSVTRFSFVEERPLTFWEDVQPEEYGFWANVNPKVPHRRWSQRTERPLGSEHRVPTQLFNGYEQFVAHLYDGLEGERLYT